ncbi:MAG: recombinase family protein, partial [Planctomycetota bacterium]
MARSKPTVSKRLTPGEPDKMAVRAMATVWLEEQKKAWPDRIANDQFATSNEETLDNMVAEFLVQFGKVYKIQFQSLLPENLATAYLRYSCDNSNMRSLSQQLRNVLIRANADKVFIPWNLIFADAAITGTISGRIGYQQAKSVILESGSPVACLYVDDIGRASRDTSEILDLARLIKEAGKGMIGASDGIDLASDNSKIMVTVNGMLNEQHIDQLRSKVNRGMRDSFLQGKVVSNAPFGYRLVPVKNPDGSVMISSNKKVVQRMEIDSVECPEVINIFDMFVNQLKSPVQIAHDLNARKVAGRNTWKDPAVKQILRRHIYTGIEYRNMTKMRKDRVTNKVTTIHIPRDQWQKREVPHLTILEPGIFEKAQAKLIATAERAKKRREAGPKYPEYSHALTYPKLLIRPICKTCRWHLVLGNSSNYSAFRCSRGYTHTGGCELMGYKSVSLIEACVLEKLTEEFFTPAFLTKLLGAANEYLLVEAQKPKLDTVPIKKRIAEIDRELERLANILASEDTTLLKVLIGRVQKLEADKQIALDHLRQMDVSNGKVPPPIEATDMLAILQKLSELLQMDVGASAAVLDRILGPITAESTDIKSKRGKAWKLCFTLNGAEMMAIAGKAIDSPTKDSWEFLSDAGWRMPGLEETEVMVSRYS